MVCVYVIRGPESHANLLNIGTEHIRAGQHVFSFQTIVCYRRQQIVVFFPYKYVLDVG